MAARKAAKQVRRAPSLLLPDEIEVEIAEIGEERLAIISWPVAPSTQAPALSGAEEAVLRGVAVGKSNAEIARDRGTSPRTVANQIASLLRKFNVSSRYELVLAISR